MRWSGQQIDSEADGALPGLARVHDLVRTVRTPEFAGMTFYEVLAKSALNKVPGRSTMPFGWTINPMRGCQHACRYCFARPTHEYLDLDSGRDFDTQIVVKINVAEVLATELRKPRWTRSPVALGTNTDPYQRAEGRYRLMPGIIAALAHSGTPISILTKGTLLRRDIPLLAEAAQEVPVDLAMSIAIYDDDLQQAIEPGTPTAAARLATVTAVRDAGLDCSVFLMPVIPHLTDTRAHLDEAFRRIAASGATSVHYSTMYLQPGVKEWFLEWLGEAHPQLVEPYQQLYRTAYAPREYRAWLADRIRPLLSAHGLTRGREDPVTGGVRSGSGPQSGALVTRRHTTPDAAAQHPASDRAPRAPLGTWSTGVGSGAVGQGTGDPGADRVARPLLAEELPSAMAATLQMQPTLF